MALVIIVLIGSINWGLIGLFDVDLVDSFASLFGCRNSYNISKVIYIMVGIAAVLLAIRRDTYLPFLGEAVMPNPKSDFTPEGELISKNIYNLPPNTKVVYWAAQSANKIINNPYDAYGDYSNHGVTTSDNNGNAILKVRAPAQYRVGMKGKLPKHIHYRYWTQNGMASRLYTTNI
jgi:uncharacterized membrane protein YuzA (DUF378 family)